MKRETENRVIELAIAKGLLSPEAVARALEQARGVGDIGGAPEPGSVLAWLVRLGALEAGDLADLRREVDEAEPTQVTPPGPVQPEAEGSTESAAESTRAVDCSPARPIDISTLAGWDRYELIALLGRGGMGEVFKAWDPRLKRHVALKFLHRENQELTARFLQEAQAQARVEHDGICKVYEVGEAGGRPYIAMQLIAGDTLALAGEDPHDRREGPRHAAGGRGTPRRPPVGPHPPRPQARQHHGRAERGRRSTTFHPRLRLGAGDRHGGDHHHGRRDGHPGLHVSRAGPGAGARPRPPRRRLRPGRHALRPPVRAPAVRGAQQHRDPAPGHPGRSAATAGAWRRTCPPTSRPSS